MERPDHPDVSVVVVTWNALPFIEQCLDSVRGRDVVIVDHGSTDGTLDFVRASHPEARIVEQENKGMGGGNNAGMRIANGRYFFLLNSDAWVVGDGLDRLVAYADEHPEAAVVGPRLLNPDGSLQRSVRAEPTLWRLATEYLFIRKLAPRSRLLNPLYAGGFAHNEEREVDWLYGPALLVRRDAVDAVGLFDEDFFMFSEEVDWMTRFRRAGWQVLFYPGAEVVHVGGASHGGRLYVENLRGHLRFMAKHRGRRAAERTRLLLLWSLRLRALVLRREAYREGVRFLSSGRADTLLK
jgi:GT2 family glycosyltransferase